MRDQRKLETVEADFRDDDIARFNLAPSQEAWFERLVANEKKTLVVFYHPRRKIKGFVMDRRWIPEKTQCAVVVVSTEEHIKEIDELITKQQKEER